MKAIFTKDATRDGGVSGELSAEGRFTKQDEWVSEVC